MCRTLRERNTRALSACFCVLRLTRPLTASSLRKPFTSSPVAVSSSRGRTKSGLDLAIETLVSTSARGRAQAATLQFEHRAVAELCEQTRSVAEVAALLSLPLGVARVVLGDMAGLGVVTVHQTASSAGSAPITSDAARPSRASGRLAGRMPIRRRCARAAARPR